MPTQQVETQGRNDTSPPTRIPKIPSTMKETHKHNYNKYFVPSVVSIGPYHYGEEKLESVEKLKLVFAMRLVGNNNETLNRLYNMLEKPDMVQDLRSYYEENSTTMFSDMEFAKMMTLDACFILYYLLYIFGGRPEYYGGLNKLQITFIFDDLYLLENQIPFKVLTKVACMIDINVAHEKLKWFIEANIMGSFRPKRSWFDAIFCIRNYPAGTELMITNNEPPNHLLHLLHLTLTKNIKDQNMIYYHRRSSFSFTFRNVRELVAAGIHFKPSATMSLACINFIKSRWWISAAVELPPVVVDDSTKPTWLNLIAYEETSLSDKDAWVTSFICFLDSLIEGAEDVEVLRKSRVLEATGADDQEVAKLFHEICTHVFPHNLAYFDVKCKIQRQYESRSNALMSQLKLISLYGVPSLFLSAVQTYFTIWSPKSECDHLCTSLRKNHHL